MITNTNNNKEAEKLARKISIAVARHENGDNQADLWICGSTLLLDGEMTNCAECGAVCYYDTKSKHILKKNHKKICLDCAFNHHLSDMTELEQKIIKYTKEKNNF